MAKVNFAAVHITTRCENNCAFCYLRTPGIEERDGDLGTLKRIANKLVIAGVETVELVGGNPSLHKNIAEIVRYFNETGLQIAILSNSHDYVHSSIEEIAPYVSALETTIHGLPEEHDKFVTPNCSYEKIIERLKKWQEVKPEEAKTGITLNLTPINCRRIYEIVKRVSEDIFVDYVQIQRIGPFGCASDYTWELYLDDVRIAYEQIKLVNEELLVPTEVVDSFPLCLLAPDTRQYAGKCDWGEGTCAIFMDGEVSRCAVNRKDLGNILETPLQEIWDNHPDLIAFREKKYLGEKCQRCSMLEECGGGCPSSCGECHLCPDRMMSLYD